MAIVIEGGIDVGPGIMIGSGSGPSPAPGINNVVGYLEMNPPVIPGQQLEDPTATINGSVGFTINDDTKTGVAIANLSASNQTFFASYGTGLNTVTWGPGSTVASSTVNIVQNFGAMIVFYIQGQTGAATYNYPFTFD